MIIILVMDTKPLEKCCSRCGQTKLNNKFISNRNICKECANKRNKEKYNECKNNSDLYEKECSLCNETKPNSSFITRRTYCKECNNKSRRERYEENEEYRSKTIKQAIVFKKNKIFENKKINLEELGEGNKKCNYCHTIKPCERFRYNRLKCRDCERDDPIDKFKRIIRSRIYSSLHNKTKHTIEYLGCTCKEYLQWMLNGNYTLENRGKEWHIDHVIPLCHFNMEDKEEQMIAFNWRNTAPLTPYENLAKNKRILKPQIEQHWKKLVEYHEKYKIEMPQKFIDLFAKHLVAGNPLEPSLPLTDGNIYEELG